MAKTPKEYTRLGGGARRRQGSGIFASARTSCSLWMGSDHLLLVERNGYTENYRRFYFTDIQAITIRKTSFATVLGAVTGILTVLFVLLALNASDLAWQIVLWIIGGFFAVFFLVNLAFGPGCVSHIQTAVQTEQIPSWNRLRATRKAIAKLRPRLGEAQGGMPPDELKAQWLAGLGQEAQRPATGAT